MDQTLCSLPILSGRIDAARAFLNELEHERKPQYASPEERLRLFEEAWAIQNLLHDDHYVVYFQSDDISDDIGQAFQKSVASQDGLDL